MDKAGEFVDGEDTLYRLSTPHEKLIRRRWTEKYKEPMRKEVVKNFDEHMPIKWKMTGSPIKKWN